MATVFESGHLPGQGKAPAQPSGQGSRARDITNLLHTSLEVEEVIGLFARHVGDAVPHDGFRYRHADHDITLDLGAAGHHRFDTRLRMGDFELGEIAFTRRRRFSDGEVATLENLLCALIYPLRNALLYREALRSAHRDPLTGLNNRRCLQETLRRETELAHRHGNPLSLIVLDIDHFKAVNDRHGHDVGDLALRAVAQCAAGCVRGSDMLFRFGGEEFVILLTNTDRDGALLLAERVRTAVEAMECATDMQSLRLTASLGVAGLQAGEREDQLFKRADKALYRAKEEGRNRVRGA